MEKIKDRIILGAVSGVLATQLPQLLNLLEHKIGLVDIAYSQIASRLFIPKSKTHTKKGILLSAIINNVNTSAAGVFVTYLLSATGRDKAVLKGTGVGCLLWILINGLTYNVGLNIKSRKPLTLLLSFIDHILFGALTGYFVSRLGDNSLFPDKNVGKQDEIPLFYTGHNRQIEKKLP